LAHLAHLDHGAREAHVKPMAKILGRAA
jgi:hypothetical protein